MLIFDFTVQKPLLNYTVLSYRVKNPFLQYTNKSSLLSNHLCSLSTLLNTSIFFYMGKYIHKLLLTDISLQEVKRHLQEAFGYRIKQN